MMQAYSNPTNERSSFSVGLDANQFSQALIGQKSGIFHKGNPLVYEYRLTLYTKTKRVQVAMRTGTN
jgi:hypothetical protein